MEEYIIPRFSAPTVCSIVNSFTSALEKAQVKEPRLLETEGYMMEYTLQNVVIHNMRIMDDSDKCYNKLFHTHRAQLEIHLTLNKGNTLIHDTLRRIDVKYPDNVLDIIYGIYIRGLFNNEAMHIEKWLGSVHSTYNPELHMAMCKKDIKFMDFERVISMDMDKRLKEQVDLIDWKTVLKDVTIEIR